MSAVLQQPCQLVVADQLTTLLPDLEARIRTWIDTLPVKAHYHTRGVYADGTAKDNAVWRPDLAIHVEYNLVFRPGRAFFVEGICVNRGYLDEAVLIEVAAQMQREPYKPARISGVYQ